MIWFIVDRPPWTITVNLSSLLLGFAMVTDEEGDSFRLHLGPLEVVYDRLLPLTTEETADLREVEEVLRRHYSSKPKT